jgi:hypothetical protein
LPRSMSVQVPYLDCALVFEVYKENSELLKREEYKKVKFQDYVFNVPMQHVSNPSRTHGSGLS